MYANKIEQVKYRSEIDWLVKRAGKIAGRGWWHSKGTKAQAAKTLHEIEVLRRRVYNLAIECSEWRWKVGGAAYDMKGPEALEMVAEGIRNRVGHGFIAIMDEDLLG